MCSFRNALVLVVALVASTAYAQASRYTGIGRAATTSEVAAWDIDVRPDFKGLPAGSGSVARGQVVWETKCASCHGVFGESNEVFNPLIGGTNAEDVKNGNVGALKRRDYPGRTTFMKLAHVSTLWDYIHRAMPWNEPKSLPVDDVYAVTAYMLNLAEIVSADYTLSNNNIAEVQKRLPNRNGLTTQHAMWPGNEFQGTRKADVNSTACMTNCNAATVVTRMPEHARNAHGNLAEQNRMIGAQRGVITTAEAPAAMTTVSTTAAPVTKTATPAAPARIAMPGELLQKHTCTACHAADRKLVGPSWNDIRKKHAGQATYLAGKIKSGGAGVWGAIPMPPQALGDDDAKRIAEWLAQGMSR